MKMRYKVIESMCKDVKKPVQEKLEGQKSREMQEKPTAKRNKRAGKKKIGKKPAQEKLEGQKSKEMQEKPSVKSNKRARKKKIGEKAHTRKAGRAKKQRNARKTLN